MIHIKEDFIYQRSTCTVVYSDNIRACESSWFAIKKGTNLSSILQDVCMRDLLVFKMAWSFGAPVQAKKSQTAIS